MQATVSSSRSSRVIHSLHAILRPFLLRRLKVDVETDLPPKKEYVLYAPLSERQRELYDAIVRGGLRALLLKEKGAEKKKETPIEIIDDSEEESGKAKGKTKDISSRTRSKKDGTAKKGKRSYADMSDREYFKKLDSGELEAQRQKEKERDAEELGKEWFNKSQRKNIRIPQCAFY